MTASTSPALSPDRITGAIMAGLAAANALKAGDEYPGAFGAAEVAGFGAAEPRLRSLFTVAFMSIWDRRHGEARGLWNERCVVAKIDQPIALDITH